LNNENGRTDLFDWKMGCRQQTEPGTINFFYSSWKNIVDLTSRESVGTPLPLLILFYAIVSDNKVET
jgi:hypothetical protein